VISDHPDQQGGQQGGLRERIIGKGAVEGGGEISTILEMQIQHLHIFNATGTQLKKAKTQL
jgi:hypothetical protein